jgi:hypothetical protein
VDNTIDTEWQRDFREFTEVEPVPPPKEVSCAIMAHVEADLDPALWLMLTKLLVVGSVAGSLSLLICPQFGYGVEMGIMRYFMRLGPLPCRVACGAFFMAACMISSALLLSREEFRKIRRTPFLLSAALSLLALVVFSCTSLETRVTTAVSWLVGAFLGGLLALESGYHIRRFVERVA